MIQTEQDQKKQNQTPGKAAERQLTDAQLEALIAQVEEQELLHAPADFKKHVMEKTKRADVQLVIRTQELSKSMQLFCYSLKIGVAAVMALFFLFRMPADFSVQELVPSVRTECPAEPEKTLTERMNDGADAVTSRITELKNQWMNKED